MASRLTRVQAEKDFVRKELGANTKGGLESLKLDGDGGTSPYTAEWLEKDELLVQQLRAETVINDICAEYIITSGTSRQTGVRCYECTLCGSRFLGIEPCRNHLYNKHDEMLTDEFQQTTGWIAPVIKGQKLTEREEDEKYETVWMMDEASGRPAMTLIERKSKIVWDLLKDPVEPAQEAAPAAVKGPTRWSRVKADSFYTPSDEGTKASSSTSVPAEDLPPPPGIPQPSRGRAKRTLEDAKGADGGEAADSEERKAQKTDAFARRVYEFEHALGHLLTSLEPSRGPVLRTTRDSQEQVLAIKWEQERKPDGTFDRTAFLHDLQSLALAGADPAGKIIIRHSETWEEENIVFMIDRNGSGRAIVKCESAEFAQRILKGQLTFKPSDRRRRWTIGYCPPEMQEHLIVAVSQQIEMRKQDVSPEERLEAGRAIFAALCAGKGQMSDEEAIIEARQAHEICRLDKATTTPLIGGEELLEGLGAVAIILQEPLTTEQRVEAETTAEDRLLSAFPTETAALLRRVGRASVLQAQKAARVEYATGDSEEEDIIDYEDEHPRQKWCSLGSYYYVKQDNYFGKNIGA